jgi:3-phenylpropionate/trans-cinnamate dioxygenase ferredoxin reductase subunit
MRRVVVVGASLAGARAVETLRRRGFEGELIVVGDEPHRPYDRPPLSKELLAGRVGPEATVRPCAAEAQWLLGRSAEALDLRRRVVTLDGGDELAFDGLVIATGSRAREWPGLPELEGFHYLRRIEDCMALRAALVGSPRVCIVGAGFIGCEVAATLRAQGVEVTVADVAPHPMPALGHAIGERCRALHEAHGVRLATESVVEAFHGVRRVEAVQLAGGERLAADLVLLAVGAVPNVEWLAGSGLRLDRGVVCDEHLQAVGAANVAAAGDVAQWPHPASGGMTRIEHWSNAAAQGVAAAANLLATPAEREPYAPVPTFWSDQYDVKIQAVGFVHRATTVEIVEELPEENRLVAEAWRDGELVGAITFNRAARISEYRRAMDERRRGALNARHLS